MAERKMWINRSTLEGIADAIRTKKGTSGPIPVPELKDEILGIEGGEIVIPEGYIKPSGTKPITTNGTHDVTEYASVNVNVPTESGGTTEVIPEGYVKPSGTLTITENGLRTLQKDDGGYYDSVNVDVQGEEPVLKAQEITENGTYNANDFNADGFSSVTVNVESSGGGAELNIAYGDTAPEDTSKLWVKTTQPSAVKVASELTLAAETTTKLSATRTENKKSKEVCSLPINDKIYLVGGVGGTYSNAIQYFDILTQTFGTISTTMPVKDLTDCATTTFGLKFYILGGYSYNPAQTSAAIYCLDTETGVVTTLSTTFPTGRRNMGYATVGNKCYMFGGIGSAADAAIFCFDAENETLTQLSTVLPTSGSNWAASADDTIIYLITTQSSKDILAFDTNTEKISVVSTHTLSDGQSSRIQHYANKIYWKGYIYILGRGYDTNSSATYAVINVADGTARVSSSAYTFLNQSCACSVVNDIVYIFYKTEVATFKLPTDILLDTDTLQIQSASSNKFNIINTNTAQVEIGVNKVYKGNADGIGEEVEASLHNGTSWVTI